MTAKGVKPICVFQQVFQTLYLFGAFSPITGDHFLLELPNCNSTNFQYFLDAFSKENESEFKIIVLDNGAFHKAKSLQIPENIGLIFLPPYSPELNPAENMWAMFKRAFTNLLCKNIKDISNFIDNTRQKLDKKTVIKTCSFPYIFQGLNWSI